MPLAGMSNRFTACAAGRLHLATHPPSSAARGGCQRRQVLKPSDWALSAPWWGGRHALERHANISAALKTCAAGSCQGGGVWQRAHQ